LESFNYSQTIPDFEIIYNERFQLIKFGDPTVFGSTFKNLPPKKVLESKMKTSGSKKKLKRYSMRSD